MFSRMLRNITVAAILMLLTVTEREWYRVQSSEGEPRDLNNDPEYSGRVSVSTWWSDCELTVRNVRVSESGVYNFRFKTQSSDWISASSGVQLTVTDLQVKVDPNTVGQREVKVTCSSTCRINTHIIYWYRNGHYIKYTNDASIVLDSTSRSDKGSYSCEVSGTEHRSPPVCVFDEKSCWSVSYSTQTVCSLIGSSVDLHSYYTFPNNYKVTEVLWFIKELEDVRKDEEYQGRVQYTQSSQNDCSLRITNLRERDAQTYRFRFYTDDPTGKYTGKPGVTLSVTDLRVTVSNRNGNKKLSCITTCSLSNNPTYIWYKNRQRVTDQDRNELYVSSGNAGSYSCAVRGHEELRSPAVCLTVIKSVWFIKVQVGVEPEDVRKDEEYQGRVQKRMWSSANDHSSTGESGQPQPDAIYENISASNCRVASDDQDDVHYSSVVIKHSHTQEVSLSPRLPPDTTEEEDVQYTAVNFSRSTAAIQ
ncbi:uncharacterized protein LOC131347601 [Hemibagrus wyckioides]|uniref:uncharacterized protein LOC131347601 n=1 Tax=Hemibagrus wyckioides TaxID=337641 RepID=UPI00266DBBBB|nr:uncharacterized protein LOC131347601 [Hemibagrus wyckioides]